MTAPSAPATISTAGFAAFGVFAVAMLILGSFKKTHSAALWIMGLLALSILIKWSKGGFTSQQAGST